MKKVNKTKYCWEWAGPQNHFGYGTFSFNGRTVGAHRAIWIMLKGKIPKGLNVLHTCDNRSCVNIDHLWLGTQKENVHDMMNKGRWRGGLGSKNGKSKLTENQVKEILKLLEKKLPQSKIAKQFGITQANVSCINIKKTWSHI